VRPGGRSARVVDEVLTATIELLAQHGYEALRVEGVACRSGVNKTTIYRRWPTKPQLVAAALHAYKLEAPAPDSGDLEHDLVEMFVASLSRFDASTTSGLMRMFQAERGDRELEAIVAEMRKRLLATRRVRLDLAVKRGELPAHTNVELATSMLSGAIYSRLHACATAPSRAIVTEIVAVIVAGLRTLRPAGPASRAASRRSSRGP
jgi:AcrR family transcriptional regulator